MVTVVRPPPTADVVGILPAMPDASLSVDDLADLLRRTGDAHHAAFASTDGDDPDWASWYAEYLENIVGPGLGRGLARSDVADLLTRAQSSLEASGSPEPWADYHARFILAELRG